MEQKERLSKLIDDYYTSDLWTVDKHLSLEQHLLANGVIVPPCKVGDTVYSMWYRPISKERFVQSSIVIGITFMKCDWFVETDDNNLHLFGSLLNKDWFTDREAAEKALKERNDEDSV